MRILMLMSTPFPPEEGIGYHVYNLSRQLIQKGHKVTILTRGELTRSHGCFDNIPFIKLPYISLYPFHVSIHGYIVNRYLKKHKNDFDLIHVHSPLPPQVKIEIPVVTTIHSAVVGDSQNNDVKDIKNLLSELYTDTFGKWLTNKLLNKSKFVITISDSVKKELEIHFYFNSSINIPNGVDVDKFKMVGKQKTASYEDVLIFVGRLSEGKGIFDLLVAFQKIHKTHSIKLIICGQGRLLEKVHEYVKIHDLGHDVDIMGHVSQDRLIELLGRSTLFVSPSYHEGLPTSVMEAMAVGTPVLLSDIPPHKELVEDEVNGFLFEKGNINDLSDKVIHILSSFESKDNIIRIARKTIENNYSWERIVDELITVYGDAIER